MKHARPDYNRFQDPDGKIPTDEPVFLLRGQDKLAARVVSFYADLLDEADGDPEMIRMCFEHADRMRRWPKKKLPDLP